MLEAIFFLLPFFIEKAFSWIQRGKSGIRGTKTFTEQNNGQRLRGLQPDRSFGADVHFFKRGWTVKPCSVWVHWNLALNQALEIGHIPFDNLSCNQKQDKKTKLGPSLVFLFCFWSTIRGSSPSLPGVTKLHNRPTTDQHVWTQHLTWWQKLWWAKCWWSSWLLFSLTPSFAPSLSISHIGPIRLMRLALPASLPAR